MMHNNYLRPSGGTLAARSNFERIIFRSLFCILVAAALFMHGCTGAPTGPEAHSPAITPSPELSEEAQIAFYMLSLNEALDKNDFSTSLAAVEELIRLAPSPELYIQQAVLYAQSDRAEMALAAVEAGADKYPDDYTLQIIWAELLEQDGQTEQALAVLHNFSGRYEKLTAKERSEHMEEISSIRQFTAYILLNGQRIDEAAAYLKTVPQSEMTATLLFYEVVILRTKGQAKLANSRLYDLAQNHPYFTDAWLTLASDMEKAGNYKGAVRFYNKALESNPLTEIYLRMLSAQIKSGDIAGAQNQVMMSPFSSEVKLQSALLFLEAREYQAARAILLTLQNDSFAADDTAMYLGMIAYESGENVKEGLERLQDISPDAPNRSRMMYLKALLHIRDNDYPSALEAARALRDEYPENREHWAFLAELANVSKDYRLAENVCREALEQWPDDIPLMYSMALSLSFQKRNIQSMEYLDDILMLDENNVMAMNALAYTLAEERRDLPRALSLANRALAYEPENTSILDTLAWVYYQMGNYREAWKNIKLCVARGAEDAVIWDHYGDIALALNKNEDARTGYFRALELKPDNSAEIRKKLRNIK